MQVGEVFGLGGFLFTLYCKSDKTQEILSCSKSVCSYGLSHGDMIYMSFIGDIVPEVLNKSGNSTSNSTVSSKVSAPKLTPNKGNFVEEEVDKILKNSEGTIKRKRDSKS